MSGSVKEYTFSSIENRQLKKIKIEKEMKND